jgi:hypothetical protein
VIVKFFSYAIAVIGAAVLTLATMVALVQGTILAVSIANPPLRILAVIADVLFGTVLLLGCIYLATQNSRLCPRIRTGLISRKFSGVPV